MPGGMRITDEQLDRYRRQGFLIIENFLTEQERSAALDGFFSLFAPPYEDYVAAGRKNLTTRQGLFPWDHPLRSERFTAAMATRYAGFDPTPYHAARAN